MKLKKRILNTTIIFFTTLLLTIVVFEVSYRFQIFDFYKAELKGLNSPEELNSQKPKILICGDSFSASPDSYVKNLRDSLINYSVVNAAVPGTGILQHTLYIPKRIKKFKPDIFIYQFYVGNDLFDISHPTSSNNISFARKIYWWTTDRLPSLSFLNFRFAGIKYRHYDEAGVNDRPKEKDIFSVGNYSNREKLNYKAEPAMIENSLYLLNGRDADIMKFEKKFRTMVKHLDPSTKKIFLIIPHQSQVSEFYFQNLLQIGASFNKEVYRISANDYPLYQKLMKLCDELGFYFFDPLEKFREMDERFQLYYSNDPHLNSGGSYFLGTIMKDKIQQILKD